ncbi:methyltransferase [Methylobacterium sp. A54F]
MTTAPGAASDDARVALLRRLKGEGYAFTTVTPATHARVNAGHDNAWARSLRDVLGWSRPFRENLLPPDLLRDLDAAEAVERDGTALRPTLRVSSLDDALFVHSSFPPRATDAVFFGPDAIRFVGAVIAHLAGRAGPVRRAVDIGTGSGAAGIAVARRNPDAEVTLVDINPAALRAARINARAAGVANVTACASDLLDAVPGDFDLIVSNPPFMLDADARTYRHGGGPLGAELSLRIVGAAAGRLTPGGSLVLFTGAAIVDGQDPFRAAAGALCAEAGLDWTYREFDPDAYGEELDGPAYAAAERLALVVLTATRGRR